MEKYLQELKELHRFYRVGRFSKAGISIALGVSRRTVLRWFQGAHPPTKKHQRSIEKLVKEFKNEGNAL
jgi:hypothetical protein